MMKQTRFKCHTEITMLVFVFLYVMGYDECDDVANIFCFVCFCWILSRSDTVNVIWQLVEEDQCEHYFVHELVTEQNYQRSVSQLDSFLT